MSSNQCLEHNFASPGEAPYQSHFPVMGLLNRLKSVLMLLGENRDQISSRHKKNLVEALWQAAEVDSAIIPAFSEHTNYCSLHLNE